MPEEDADHPHILVRHVCRTSAAVRGRIEATRLGTTLYLGRDRRNHDHLVYRWPPDGIECLDPEFGTTPIPPRGNYLEQSLVEDGRAPWFVD